MNTLVFDTETSGLPQKNLPFEHPEQPRIVQLACVLLDKELKEIGSFCSLIKPSGWTIHPKAQEAHGISLEECEASGISIEVAWSVIASFNATCINRVAHNISFDRDMLCIEYHKNPDYYKSNPFLNHSMQFCTMLATTPICKLPKKGNWGDKYKWPRLSEAYSFLFNEPLEDAHNALIDVRATARIYRWLVSNKLA